MRKRYGDVKTNLTLTEKAANVYVGTDPLDIYEYETEDGLRYDVEGATEEHGLTDAEVIELLESWDIVTDGVNEIDFDLAVSLMDDEIREKLHSEMSPCLKQEFYDAYCEAHEEKYGTPFVMP